MITFLEYELKDIISESAERIIQRAVRQKDGSKVVIKSVRETSDMKSMSRILHEYELLNSINSAGILKPIAFENREGLIAIIFEDTDGISLKHHSSKNKLSVEEILRIGIQLSQTLGEMHSQNVIHKDIKPDNIIINYGQNRINLIDFGISSRINLKTQHLGNPEVLEGTLEYISPEQTGRMNRVIDYRSDLYSLGVTFYELLTGNVPFVSKDPMELVHSHIAVSPKEPNQLDKNIPLALSNILMKLLSKNAEDRYQSAFGLKADFEKCLKDLELKNKIEMFKLGEKDFAGKFQISQKLYGRSNEVKTLLDTFDRTAKGSTEIILVSGFSGVGKSALVNEVHKPITEKRGNFISGKYDQFQKNIPYYAIKQAFEEFTSLLLTFSKKELEIWKEKILSSVGTNGQVLIDIIPNLELVIGKQSPVTVLGPQESQNRFNLVFQNFIKAIATQNHPLVIFIDDLQWADSASLILLKVIMTDSENHNLLLIGAYRDNEVDSSHPFIMTLDDIKKSGIDIENIVLKNLTKEDVNELISEALSTNVTNVLPLSELVYSKTSGNAFFTNEFFKSLYEESLLKFDFQVNKWVWDIDKIHDQGITDNVVELMTQKLNKLPIETQEVLKYASCIGNKFELKILSIIHEKSQYDTFRDLWKSVEEGLIFPLDENYKMIQSMELHEAFESVNKFEFKHDTIQEAASQYNPTIKKEETSNFKFGHDRIQQASYALIPENRKKEIHIKIGRLLYSNTSLTELEERIFDIVNQFNNSLDLISDETERIQISELNLKAGKKAINSSAFSSALVYLNFGKELLNESDWEKNHDLIWNIYREKASCEFSTALLENCENTIKIVLPKCNTEDEKVSIYKIYLNVLFPLNKHFEAIDVMREALKYLGVNIPKKIGKQHVAIQYARFRLLLGTRKAADILNLPDMHDPHIINICKVLYDCVESTYIVAPDMMGYLSVLMANYCLKYGNSIYAPFAYNMVAAVMSGVTKELELAYKFSTMAIALNVKYPNTDVKARIHFITGNFNLHWIRPISEHLPFVKIARLNAKESGNIHWGNYATTFCRPQSILFNSQNLVEIEKENINLFEFYLNSKDREVTLNQVYFLNLISFLKGDNSLPYKSLAGYNPDDYGMEMATPGNFLMRTYYYAFNMFQDYTFGNLESALDNGWKSFKIVLEVLGVCVDFVQRYYFLLTVLSLQRKLKGFEKIKIGFACKLNRFLIKYYAKKNPTNFLGHWLLVQAEEARVDKKVLEAEKLYDQAIEEAEKAGFTQNIALANELAGKFYLTQNRNSVAKAYMLESHRLYTKWGAMAKVKDMENKYPEIFQTLNKEYTSTKEKTKTITLSNTTSTTTVATTGMLDMTSVLKSSQALSGEIQLDKLLSKMMTIVLENAGAEKGVLLLEESGNLLIQARRSGNETKVMESLPSDNDEFVPDSMIQYVYRTKTNLILSDASKEGSFTQSKHVIQKRPKSVLCTPITKQGKLFGILYLENNLTTGAFTKDRIKTLSILSSQVAVSIENALLYENLEQKVEERTYQLRESMKGTQDILLNVEQGILTINRDFSINPDYSRKVLEIFGVKELNVKDFRVLVSEEKRNKVQNFIELLFENPFMSAKMFKKSNPLKEYIYVIGGESVGEAYMHNLQTSKQLSFSFSRIFKLDNEGNKTDEIEKIMVVIDDKTSEYELQKRLEEKTKEQTSKVEKMYQILGMDARIFSGFIKEANETIESIKPKLVGIVTGLVSETSVRVIETNRKIIEETFRAVHSLKGNARALNLESIGERAHKLEDELDKLRNNVSAIQKEFIERTLKALDEFHAEIKDGSSIFEKILGMKSALGDSKATVGNPVEELKNFLGNTVKKEAAGLGKDIEFAFVKEGEEISEEVLAKLKNPLIQIIKNSIDHGIEKPEVRVQSGKSAKGRISVRLHMIRGKLVVDCEDDGKGLNAEKIKNKAVQAGLIKKEEAIKLTKKELFKFIFLAGFSTAENITGISGRGVGMDIVRDDIERLGGSIRIETHEGKFTRFSIVVNAGKELK